jgi:malonyl-CoA O-methyltransferase
MRLDHRALRRSFNRAGRSYDQAATLQATVRKELLTRLQYFGLQPLRILDLGAGTGESTVALKQRFAAARVMAVDVALQMLRQAGRRRWPWQRFTRVCADASALPLASGSVDLIFCSLMLQWCEEPHYALAEMRRVLKPGGLLLFSSFGPLTLHELREAWAQVDAHPHVSDFVSLPDLGAALSHAGFAEPVLDVETYVSYYVGVHTLAQELRAIGARNAATARARGLTSRGQWQRLQAAYELRRVARGLPATYEVIYGAAFARAQQDPDSAATGRMVEGEVAVPVASLRRRPSTL